MLTKSDLKLIEKTDETIAELVYAKTELLKAYNIYDGIRDKEQFKYLEDNFGIGNPTSVEFTPLVRKHVDALVGEFLSNPILPKVSCKDKETINNIGRDKQLKICQEVSKYLQLKLSNQILRFISGQQTQDASIKEQLDSLIEDLQQDFISDYEIAAQNVIQYIMQHRRTDFLNKLRQLLLDLLICGYNFYKVKPSTSGENVEIEVLDPRNVFMERNPESPYVKDSYRIVVRHWMTAPQILNKYGKELDKEDVKKLKESWRDISDADSKYVRSYVQHSQQPSDGLHPGEEVIPGYPYTPNQQQRFRLIPVYEVEWIDVDDDFVMQRYESIRIGDSMSDDSFYILRGKNEDVVRTKDNPSYCSLSVNGVYFLNRGPEPFSLVLACANLQDKYDLLNFYRDNLIATSGTIGDWIDESLIPTNLGVNWPERIQKWLAYKKAGIGLLDTAQESRAAAGQAPMNTIFNGFDDTIKAQSIQAIQMAIDSVEQTCSSITGVFRERLNGIEQRDAVSNIKVGQNNSFIITKQWFHQMDLIVAEMLTDALNVAKVVYKDGLTGTLILGDKYQKEFTALPEHFTVSDFDIHVLSSADASKDLEMIKQYLPDFIKGGALSPDLAFEAILTKSPTDIKWKVRKAFKKQEEKNNAVQQLQQQLQETQQQMQQMQNELSKAQAKVESLNEQRMQLDSQKIQLENQVKMFQAQTDRTYKEAEVKVDQDKVKIEEMQLRDGNPYNDKVNMS